MGEYDGAQTPIEKRTDLGQEPGAGVSYWLMQLRLAEREEINWVNRARKIINRYRDERGSQVLSTAARFNMLWSMTETLKPWLYSRGPTAEVERRFKDADPKGRLASQILERCLRYEDDADNFDTVMRAVVEDRLLPGRGIARVLYVPYYDEPNEPEEEEEEDGETEANEDAERQQLAASGRGDGASVVGIGSATDAGEALELAVEPVREVVWEEARVDYVFWEDFRCSPARRWKEVTWVAFRSYLTRAELENRFPECGKDVTLDYTPKGLESYKGSAPADGYKKATVWEIWDKTKRKVVWIAPSYSKAPLDEQPDPLGLTNFFPCPQPLTATTTNDRLTPVPDYLEYQDQALELDTITARLAKHVEALKVKGVYAGSEKAVLSQLITAGGDNVLVPCDDWMALAQKGGLKNLIEWLPIEQIAGVMLNLYQAREHTKQVIYEVTGLADIIRANTQPQETATAQQLKSNFATMRLSESQREVARFARDMVRLRAEVISRHFSDRTMQMMSNLPEEMPARPEEPMRPGPNRVAMDPNALLAYEQEYRAWQAADGLWQEEYDRQQKQFADACNVLRADAGRGFRVDIETDSTVAADEQQDKQLAIEFVTQVTAYLEKAVPAAKADPTLAPLLVELLMFAVRHFKAGRSVEAKLQEAMDKILEAAKQAENAPQQAPADPALVAAQTEQQTALTKAAVERERIQTDAALETRQQDIDAANDAADRELDRQKAEADTTIAAARELNAGVRAVRTLRQPQAKPQMQ